MFEPDEEEIAYWTALGKQVLNELDLDIVNNAMRWTIECLEEERVTYARFAQVYVPSRRRGQ